MPVRTKIMRNINLNLLNTSQLTPHLDNLAQTIYFGWDFYRLILFNKNYIIHGNDKMVNSLNGVAWWCIVSAVLLYILIYWIVLFEVCASFAVEIINYW